VYEGLPARALKAGAQYCDVRVERRFGLSLEFKDGEPREAVPGDEQGLCVRVLYKGAWGLASTNDMSRPGVERTFSWALRIARAKSGLQRAADAVRLAPAGAGKVGICWKVARNPHDVSVEAKSAYLLELSRAARSVPGVKTVTAFYADGTRSSHFVSSEGADVRTEVTRSLSDVSVVVKTDRGLLGNRARVGGTAGWEIHEKGGLAQKGVEAARTALALLNGDKAPSGRFPVVADPDLAGVFAHEAVGHAAEGDLIVAGDSCLEGRLGQRIGSRLVTLVDDPTIPGAFGSFPYDDEGVPARRKVLIDKGVFTGYILDRESARRLRAAPNGAARAESYGARPLVRMSNTLIEAGGHSHEEIFEGIKFGIYAKGTRGGQVDTAKGSFQFACREAYMIEKGEVTRPLRSLALSGGILHTLREVVAVGKDRQVADPGYCGKGQTVPVGDGGPHIRIRSAAVGGG
jgi:TldD protein